MWACQYAFVCVLACGSAVCMCMCVRACMLPNCVRSCEHPSRYAAKKRCRGHTTCSSVSSWFQRRTPYWRTCNRGIQREIEDKTNLATLPCDVRVVSASTPTLDLFWLKCDLTSQTSTSELLHSIIFKLYLISNRKCGRDVNSFRTWTCVCLIFHFKFDVCRSGGHLFDIFHLFDICPFVRHLLSGWVNTYWHPCLPFPSPFFLVPATQQSRAAGQPPKQPAAQEPAKNQAASRAPSSSPGEAQQQHSRAAGAANQHRQRHTAYIFLLRPRGGPISDVEPGVVREVPGPVL